MAENESQGISRRDLLKRGAALGGAVVWATPVVQTLGMGRAFANTASPVDGGEKDVSYVVITWTCDGNLFKVKWEEGVELTAGTLPDCEVGGTYASAWPEGLDVKPHTDSTCVLVDVPKEEAFTDLSECDGPVANVTAWVKAGSSTSTDGSPCNSTPLNLDDDDQLACSA